MGNCQAIDAATLIIQHPSGKIDKLYWPISAFEVMRSNPGHYVALLISTTLCSSTSSNNAEFPNTHANNPVRLTRIKLLRPMDNLVLGQVYRLITTQEVMKTLSAKKNGKVKKNHSGELEENLGSKLKENQVKRNERHGERPRTSSNNSGSVSRSRTWQPSLNSIIEATS